MNAPILTTKLFIPPLRENLIPRSHLIEKLNKSTAYPLTLISASAGSGKTTILSEWVAKNDRPVVWISLDPGDNDPVLFLIYFINAVRTIREKFGEEALAMLGSSQAVPLRTILTNLINEVSELAENFTLICDDYHVITDPRTNELITYMIDHMPPQMHLIFASRIDPMWPLARYRARNQLFEIRDQDLRFSLEEAAEFLNHTMDLNLSVEDVKALEERTEGWVAGLQLAALSLQGQSDIPGFVKAFTGSQIYVAEYLVEEILRQQPEDVQSFLLQTSLLERLNASLCEAVSGCVDGQAILMSLHRGNVFVIPLDHEGRWFRYHHMFADLLQVRLQQTLTVEAVTAVHRRASLWYERNAFNLEAINHALAAKDYERVARLVEQKARTLIFTGRVSILRDWLEDLPKATYQAHPQLTFYLFWIDVLQSKADLSEQAIQETEDRLKALPSSPENDRLRGELMAVVCRAMTLSGRTSRGIRLAQEALTYLAADDLASRARANSALATAYDFEGRADEATPVYQESISQAIAAGDYRLAAHTMMVKGLIQCHYGQLHQATRTFQAIIDMGDRGDFAPADRMGAAPEKFAGAGKEFFPAGQGYIGLGCIYLEWNDLKTAEDHLKQGMELCRRGGLDGIFIGRVRMSRLRQAKGDLEGALEEIQLPQRASQRVDDFNIATRQIQIGLAGGDVEGAVRLAAPLVKLLESDVGTVRLPLLFLEILEAIIARVYLAQGEVEKALQLLDRLQSTAEPSKRSGRLIEVHLLRALAYQKQNRGNLTPEAIESIEHALELGEPEGYVRLFLEEGPALIPLLNAVLERQAEPEWVTKYTGKLLDAFGGIGIPPAVRAAGEAGSLVEKLTRREIEVLELLAAGDSNQAIADKLFITVRTVKKHASNIYGKLNVSSRTQAVAQARELGLLSTD